MTEQRERHTGDIIRETERFACPVRRAAYYMDAFLGGPMCGKCFPCAIGSREAAMILKDIVSRGAAPGDIDALRRIAHLLSAASRCKKGRDTAGFLAEMLGAGAFTEHALGRCPDRECTSLCRYRIIPERCTMCGECEKVCAHHAIIGERRVPYLSGYLPFEIISRRCTRCGECLTVCPKDAIVIEDGIDIAVTAAL